MLLNKAISYHTLLKNAEKEEIGVNNNFIFVKSEHRYFKIHYDDILFIEGLKVHVIIHTSDKRIITKMYIRTVLDLLP